MKSLRAFGSLVLSALAISAAPRAEAAERTWNYLTTGNGLGFQVYDTNQKKITTFLDHPYRYVGPKPDPKSDGWPRRNLAFDVYFGLRAPGGSGWLNTPASAGDVEYVEESNIIHAPVTLGGVSADAYYFSPFDFDGNMMVAVLHAPGASDGYLLLNFHMGGQAGQPESDPPSNGESVSAVAAQMALTETGPGGGAMVYVPLGGVDNIDCQGVFDKVKGGQDLGNNQSCSGSDIVPAFQKKLGADGWMAVAIGFTESAGDGANMAKRIADWAAGRAPDKILEDAKAEWNAWRKPPPKGVLCASAQLRAWRQAETVLRMGQVREPYTSSRRNHGMMLASLPPGEWHSGWVRDGTFGVVGLARSGHVEEARQGVEFFLNASPVGKYKSYVSNQNYQVSVVRYFGTGEEEADYSGQPTPNVETDGWGATLWAARQVLEASGDVAWLDTPTKLGPTVYQSLVNGIAKPMEANLESNGIMKADSGIWEVHDANKKHFAFTTMSAARGFCDLAAIAKKAGKDADYTKYSALAKKVREAFLASFVDQKGALGGSLEEISANQPLDGAVAAAFTWNILSDFTGPTASTTVSELEKLVVSSGGYKRNDDGLSSYDNNEWILVDLLIANANRRNGQTQKADSILKLVLEQASLNYYLIPELYNAVTSDGAIGKYTGSIPMVGYGAGAYIMTMLDRAGIIEPNDCGDGVGATQPSVLCDVEVNLDAGAGGSDIGFGGGSVGPGPGADGGVNGEVPYGTGACLCRAGESGGGAGSAVALAGGVVSLLAARRARRRLRAKAR